MDRNEKRRGREMRREDAHLWERQTVELCNTVYGSSSNGALGSKKERKSFVSPERRRRTETGEKNGSKPTLLSIILALKSFNVAFVTWWSVVS